MGNTSSEEREKQRKKEKMKEKRWRSASPDACRNLRPSRAVAYPSPYPRVTEEKEKPPEDNDSPSPSPPLPRKTSSCLVARPLSLRRSVLRIGSQLDDDPLRKGDTTQQHLPPGACPPSFADGAISIFAPAPGRCAEIGSASSCFCETIL